MDKPIETLNESQVYPTEKNYDITSGESWDRILKFLTVNILIGIAVAIICYGIIYLFAMGGATYARSNNRGDGMQSLFGALGGAMIGVLVCIPIVLLGQMYALGYYESWRGCYIKTE